MSNEQEIQDKVDVGDEAEENNKAQQANETEFKVTVRKLEMPVRPRGVLAE